MSNGETGTEKLTTERLGEIALLGVQQLTPEKRFVVSGETAESMVRDVALLGITRKEALQFCEEMVHRAVTKVFAWCRQEGDGSTPATGDSSGSSGQR